MAPCSLRRNAAHVLVLVLALHHAAVRGPQHAVAAHAHAHQLAAAAAAHQRVVLAVARAVHVALHGVAVRPLPTADAAEAAVAAALPVVAAAAAAAEALRIVTVIRGALAPLLAQTTRASETRTKTARPSATVLRLLPSRHSKHQRHQQHQQLVPRLPLNLCPQVPRKSEASCFQARSLPSLCFFVFADDESVLG